MLTEAGNKTYDTYDMVYIAVFTVVLAICSWISIPTQIPFTFQTFGVFMAVGVLGGRRGTLTVLVYLLLGAVGIPVFSGFRGGVGILLSANGGYLIGFLFSAIVMWGIEKILAGIWKKSPIILFFSMLIGLLTCYLFGSVWFMAVYAKTTGAEGFAAVLGWCVIPFIIPDLIKVSLAFMLAKKMRRYIDHR